jgi:uncharacterized membrane protein (UPF0127 family)
LREFKHSARDTFFGGKVNQQHLRLKNKKLFLSFWLTADIIRGMILCPASPRTIFQWPVKLILSTLSLFGSAVLLAQDVPQLALQRTTLNAGMHQISAQVARTPEQRQIGLMHRKEMPQQEGMVFIFEEPAQQCFWMKNTLLPLTAAFVADDGSIVNLADMKPQTTDSHCSTKPVRYVLEMNQGWFAKKGLKAGAKLGGSLFEVKR